MDMLRKCINTILLLLIAIGVGYQSFTLLRVEVAARKTIKDLNDARDSVAEYNKIQHEWELARKTENRIITPSPKITPNKRELKRNKEIEDSVKYEYRTRIYNNYDSTICYFQYPNGNTYQVNCNPVILSKSEGSL